MADTLEQASWACGCRGRTVPDGFGGVEFEFTVRCPAHAKPGGA